MKSKSEHVSLSLKQNIEWLKLKYQPSDFSFSLPLLLDFCVSAIIGSQFLLHLFLREVFPDSLD